MKKMSKTNRKNRLKKMLIVILVIIIALVIACMAYIGKYYHSEVDVDDYLGYVENESGYGDSVIIEEMGQDIGEWSEVEGLYIYESGNENLIIFYPGAKVEYTSYLPLCYELAANGVNCYIVKMPGNLAFFGMDKAEKIMETYDYDNYYLAGHSLGGAMGASFAAEHLDELSGMIFLAAYPTKSLAADDFQVLSIYGSEDTVLNMEKVEEGRQYMPNDYVENCIEGGNHAQFGNYGTQKGDGEASITAEEQQRQTVNLILEMVQDNAAE